MRIVRLASALALTVAIAACGGSADPKTAPSGSLKSTAPSAQPSSAPAAGASGAPVASASAAAPAMSPEEIALIYRGGLTALRDAGTFHFEARLTGDFDAKGLKKGVVDLSTIRFFGDVDLANRAASTHFEAPVLGNLKMNNVFIGDVEYGQASISKMIWSKRVANGSLGLTLAALSDVAGAKGFEAALAEGRVVFTSEGEGEVDGVATHRLLMTVKVPAAQDLEGFLIGALGTKKGTPADANPWPSAGATTDVTVHFDFAQDDFRPLQFRAALDLGLTEATVVGVFSDLGKPVVIKAPKGAVDATNLFNPYN